MYEMNYHTDIVNFFFGGGRVPIREGRLFRKSYFLEGRLSDSGRSLDQLQYLQSNEKRKPSSGLHT